MFGLARKKLKENPISNLLQWCALLLATRSFTGTLRSRVGKRNTSLFLFDITVFGTQVLACPELNLAYEPAFWFSTTLGLALLFLPQIYRISTNTQINNICSFLQCCYGVGALATGMPYIGKWEQVQYRERADPR